jgi:hypothetical protein
VAIPRGPHFYILEAACARNQVIICFRGHGLFTGAGFMGKGSKEQVAFVGCELLQVDIVPEFTVV